MTCPRCQTINPDGAMTCASCGAPLMMGAPAAPPVGAYAPPYGAPPPGGPMPYGQPYMMMPQQATTSGMAIAGFVLSILGFLYLIPAIIGLILSIVGLNQVKASNGTKTGGGLAIAGIIIAVCWLLLFGVIIAIAIAYANSAHHY